jgi:ribosomal protein L11 methyltransferase
MSFLQLILDIQSDDPERFENALFAAGASSVSLADAADNPVLEPGPGELPLWPTVTVSALFDGAADSIAILAALAAQLGSLPPHRWVTLADRAWEREWLKDFRPMQFGRRLWVCPGGMRPPYSTDCCIVELDPGLAFGTGTHPTTALCLEWLDGIDLNGRTVIDYGCGSGILAIAALKLGARSAVGIDIDNQALLASRNNAQRNGVSDQLGLLDTAPAQPADIMLANILAGPLHDLAPQLALLVAPDGWLVLSGILAHQAADLAPRYAAWFDMQPPTLREEWARMVGRRKAVGSRL